MDIFCFFGGVLYWHTYSKLVLVFLFLFILFRPNWRSVCCFGLGCLWSMGHQWVCQEQGMPTQAVLRQATLSGVIASIPKQNSEKTQFEMDLYTLDRHSVRAHIQLNCYRDCPSLHAGEYWTLRAKLHETHNLNNPGGFDYKTHLAAKHIHWVGYVLRNSMQRQNQSSSFWKILVMREKLATHLAHLLKDETSLGIAQALTIGVTTHIDPALWTLFRCTGTTHLMVISGAHIGLVAGMLFKLILGLWSRFPGLCLWSPAQKIAGIVAIFTSIIYAVIAGFGAPAERATVAAGFLFIRYVIQRQFGAWQVWRYALLTVVMTEPHAVLMPGFYLSFMAVAILLSMNQRILSQGIRKAFWIQMSCMVGLLPFTLFWFSYGAINGIVANIIAIPWVSFIIVPLAFICLLMGQYMDFLPALLHLNIHYFLFFLRAVDHLSSINLQLSYANIVMPLATLGGLGLYLLMPVRALWPIIFTLWAAALYPLRPQIPNHTFEVKILDVGQGLAILIQTHKHALLYDTGGKNYQGSDMGQMVILPYLKHIGLQHLDKIIVSHPDLDHRGGLRSLQARFPKTELIVDNPQFYRQGTSCHQYQDWTWDDVHFHFFPLSSDLGSTNNHSCVLQVMNSSGQVLLTGDIEKIAEQALIQHYGKLLRSTILIVPHHGSNTSSSKEFLRAVAPHYAIMSYGFDNRYHFPHAQTLQRYHDFHIKILSTADQGLIGLRFEKTSWTMI